MFPPSVPGFITSYAILAILMTTTSLLPDIIIMNKRLKGMMNINKRKSKWRYVKPVLASILVVWITIYFFPASKKDAHPYFEHDKPLLIAHQGGEQLAPSSTLEAFENAVKIGADVIEFDVHMTKDGHLVAIHDPTVDRTTNGTGVVNDMTLAEVQSLDAGAYFKDLDGTYSFKDQGVYIPTVEEIFAAVPNMRWNIEIKDTNDPSLYIPIAEKLWEIIKIYGLEEDVLLASFDQDIVEIILQVTNGKALVSGGRDEVKKFVILHKLFLNGLYRPHINVLQIPTEEGRINLKDRKLIRGAEKKGMEVHYWTINDEQTMRELIDLGASGIITDRPDLLADILNEK